MIDDTVIYTALVIISLLMVILSVPSIFLLSWNSVKQVNKYRFLRAFKEMDDSTIPAGLLNDWTAVKTDIGYAALITEELEKMGSIRSPMFQAEIASLLIVIMAFVPGYTTPVLILMMSLLALCIIAVIYGSKSLKTISKEYALLLREMEEKGEKANDNMYG